MKANLIIAAARGILSDDSLSDESKVEGLRGLVDQTGFTPAASAPPRPAPPEQEEVYAPPEKRYHPREVHEAVTEAIESAGTPLTTDELHELTGIPHRNLDGCLFNQPEFKHNDGDPKAWGVVGTVAEPAAFEDVQAAMLEAYTRR